MLVGAVINVAEKLLGIRQEVTADVEVAGGVQDELHGSTLADLDLITEHVMVIVAQLKRGNGHNLRNGTELEDGRLLQFLHVVQAVQSVLQRVRNHVVQAEHGFLTILPLLQVLDLLGVVRPDLTRVEDTGRLLSDVLQVVADNVCLLKEETHGVANGLHRRALVALV